MGEQLQQRNDHNQEYAEHWHSQAKYWYNIMIDGQRAVEYAARQHENALRMLGAVTLRQEAEDV